LNDRALSLGASNNHNHLTDDPMSHDPDETVRSSADDDERRLMARYVVLTLALAVPLLLSFAFIRNLFPFAAYTQVKGGGDLQTPYTYYVLRGETGSGEIIDLPAVKLTDALSNIAWSLVPVVIENKNFKIASPHPANVALITGAGGAEKLPEARRLDDLLKAWGSVHNSRLSADSPQRLKAVRLDAYVWPGGRYSNYDSFVRSWRVEL